MRTYDPRQWYWRVRDSSQVWSSAKAAYVGPEDADYADFLSDGNEPNAIASIEELAEVFAQQYPGGMLSTYAADARWRREVGGIAVAGVPVATDDRSKQMIIGARVAADADADWTTQWVGADGNIYPIDAAAIVAISDAVQAHVNACFATFANVKAEIDAGTITTRTEIDAAFAD